VDSPAKPGRRGRTAWGEGVKTLVFGKTGQVATELARQAEVISLDRTAADLSAPETCARLIAETDADVIINAAAYTAVDHAEEDEERATLINGHAPAAMAKAAAAKGIPFLHISTDYVFDGTGTRPWRVDDAVAPLGAYGRSKLIGEQGVLRAGGTFAVLRTSWVVSAHGANFIKTMLRLGKERSELNVVSDQIGGPTPAADIATALLSMANNFVRGQGVSGIYHFSGAPDVSWADFAREIFRQADMAVTVNDIASSAYPTKAKRPSNSRMDCSDLELSFGIERPDWRQGLTRIVDELGVNK
jgi:dTDP-4-dehydrorhamnose reductase